MAQRRDALDQLLITLNVSGIQRTNTPLYEVIKALIGRLKELSLENGGSGSSSTTIINQIGINGAPGMQGDDGDDGSIGAQGIQGIQGAIGNVGPAGPPTLGPMGLDGNDGDDGLPIPGQIGVPGPQGNKGDTGLFGAPGLAGEDGDDGLLLPLLTFGWELAAVRVCSVSANEDFPSLGHYTELFIIFDGITKATTGLTSIRVSTDNGASFLAALADYKSVAGSGIVTNSTLGMITTHITNATASRSGFCEIKNFNGFGTPKYAFSQVAGTLPEWILNAATELNPLNAIRVLGSGGGNLTGGTIYVFGRRN